MRETLLRVGELARRTGLSVRALHYYEEIGLVAPSHRSAAGHRLYTSQDVARLQRVAVLRGLGLSLEQIAGGLDAGGPELLALVEGHLQAVRARIAEATRLRDRLDAMARRLRAGEAASVDQLIDDIEVMTMIEKYYSEEQMRELQARAEALGPAGMEAAQRAWQDLIRDVKAEVARGGDPKGPAGQALAERWRALIEAFTGGDAGIRGSLDRMYREEPGVAARHGVDPEVSAFIQRALA
jgi:MerR family transcriptional regulator, thiopeptide resistance regulator